MKVRNLILRTGFLFAILCSAFPGVADQLCFARQKGSDPSYIFYKGNSLYEQAQYDEAIAQYRRLLDEGFESGNLYYNLGNCYFKKGELGKAILNYERAKRLIPRDKDLDSNYKYAKSLVKKNVSEPRKGILVRLIVNFFNRLSISEVTTLLSVIYVLVILIVIVNIYLRINKRYLITAISVLLVFFALNLVSLRSKVVHLKREGVIIKESVDARFEPFARATIHFTLYEGMKVYLLSAREDWYKVRRSDGKTGWIEKSVLEII